MVFDAVQCQTEATAPSKNRSLSHVPLGWICYSFLEELKGWMIYPCQFMQGSFSLPQCIRVILILAHHKSTAAHDCFFVQTSDASLCKIGDWSAVECISQNVWIGLVSLSLEI